MKTSPGGLSVQSAWIARPRATIAGHAAAFMRRGAKTAGLQDTVEYIEHPPQQLVDRMGTMLGQQPVTDVGRERPGQPLHIQRPSDRHWDLERALGQLARPMKPLKA